MIIRDKIASVLSKKKKKKKKKRLLLHRVHTLTLYTVLESLSHIFDHPAKPTVVLIYPCTFEKIMLLVGTTNCSLANTVDVYFGYLPK